MHALKSW